MQWEVVVMHSAQPMQDRQVEVGELAIVPGGQTLTQVTLLFLRKNVPELARQLVQMVSGEQV